VEAVKHDDHAVLAAPGVDPVHGADLLEERQIALEMALTRRDVRETGPTDQDVDAGADVGLHAGHYPRRSPRPHQRAGHDQRPQNGQNRPPAARSASISADCRPIVSA
jgi:hypothetical protein